VASAAEIQVKIDELEARIASFAGVRSTQFADQATQFSLEDAHRELARLQQQLSQATRGSSTRYAATRKGC